jgi:hypothetical protein
LVASLRAHDGGLATTLLVNSTPIRGLVYALASFILAGVMGALGARFVDARTGLLAAGITLAWPAGRAGQVDVILRAAESASPLVTMAIEGAIVGVLGILLASFIYALGKPKEQVAGVDKPTLARVLPAAVRRAFVGPGLLIALPVAIVIGAAGAWLIALSPLKGQTISAAIVAGVIGGAAGRIADYRIPAQSLMVAIAILATVGPLTAFIFKTGASPVEAAYAGRMFALSWIAPLDWVAGGLIGVPLGVSWAASLIEKRVSA